MKGTVRTIMLMAGILAASGISAQRLKYKDLYPTLDALSLAERRNALMEYIMTDQDHPNANFRLALVYEQNYRSADPLTDIEYMMANANQAKLRFLKCIQLLDEKEVSRNNEYYAPIFKTFDSKGKPYVEPSVVAKKLSNAYDSAVQVLQKMPPIYQSFTRSVNYYDKAVKAFARINDSFVSMEDLYLLYDPTIENQLLQLKQDYDSATSAFDRYIRLTKAYPIPFHNQQYHVKPIVTYRLDGLMTSMNFLTDDVEFWNYAGWVDQVKKSVNTEIAALRSKLISNEEKLDKSITALSAYDNKPIESYKLDKELVFNLNNYDKQSLVLALLEYKSFKLDWLFRFRSITMDTINHMTNAEIYSNLIYANRSADTLIETVKERMAPDKIRKHQKFFEKFYGTAEGVKKYSDDEKKFIGITLEEYSGGLESSLMSLASGGGATADGSLIKFGKLTFSAKVGEVTSERLLKGEPMTLINRRNSDGSSYLLGVYTIDKKANNIVTFVLRIGPDGKPAWVKNFDFRSDSLSKVPDTHNYPGPIVLTQEGCALIIRSSLVNGPDKAFNTLVYLNEKGEEKFKVKLREVNFPRKVTYVEQTNSFTVLLKGVTEKQDYSASEPITLLGINALGDAMWRRSFDMTGTFSDLVNVIDGFVVVGNYAIIRDLGGKEYRTKATGGECSPFLVKLNERGEIIHVGPIQSEKSVYILKVIKVNDTSINLLGCEATFESGPTRSLSPPEKIIHFMFNRHNELIYSKR